MTDDRKRLQTAILAQVLSFRMGCNLVVEIDSRCPHLSVLQIVPESSHVASAEGPRPDSLPRVFPINHGGEWRHELR